MQTENEVNEPTQDQITEGAAPEDQAAQAQDGQQAAQPEPKKEDEKRDPLVKPGIQKRIDELTRQRHEAEREAAYWKQRAEQGQGAEPAKAAPAKPTPDKFENYAEYVEALTDWKASEKVREAMAERDREQAQRAKQTEVQARTTVWSERLAAAREELPDYDEVLAAADVPVSDAMRDVIMDSDYGPQIAYHLAKNTAEATRIARMSPLAAAREIGRIEASLSSKSAEPPTPKPVSKAPTPIQPLRSAGGQFAKSPETMSDAEWFASRRKA